MSTDFSPELRGELLDDFYAECDELLRVVREGLRTLETVGKDQEPEPTTVEALFRSFHTLKGISAIVGLRPAEQVAHAMEDVLRACAKSRVSFSPERLDTLQVATQRLEQIVTAHRLGRPLPAAADILAQLSASVPSSIAALPSAPAGDESPAATMEAGAAAGGLMYTAVFAPSPALDARGVNVSSVRTRLKAIGEIIRASPIIGAQGSVVFNFAIRVERAPANLAAWSEDGVQLVRVVDPEPPIAITAEPAPVAVNPTDALSIAPSHIVRVDLARLDDLMRITGEMVIHRSRLEERIQSAADSAGLKEIHQAMGRSLRELREAITRVRMVPIAEIFTRMPFVVRDLARDTKKKIRVNLEGPQTEVDKYLVERLKEPLLHLVRNAVAHGIEEADERASAGKPGEATIELAARSEGAFVVITIRDDGRGIDFAAIAARGTRLGLSIPHALDATAVIKILCAPGFSTREEADLAAGRGVGMAVVANTVRELGGTLRLETKVGEGSTFTLKLPLTLSIADAILARVGEQTVALPQSAINEIVQVSASDVRLIEQTAVIPYRGGLLPIMSLRKFFRLPANSTDTLTVLVCGGERSTAGLLVDRVRGQREVVIRPLSDPLLRVAGISGATELGDGRPVLILDPFTLAQTMVRSAPADQAPARSTAPVSSS